MTRVAKGEHVHYVRADSALEDPEVQRWLAQAQHPCCQVVYLTSKEAVRALNKALREGEK